MKNNHQDLVDATMYSMRSQIAHDNFISELETRKAEDKLWMMIVTCLGLFVAGYGLYQFIRFIVEGFTLK
jgi:hypothetical protein